MNSVLVVIVIALTLIIVWLLLRPKQGKVAAHAPSSQPDALMTHTQDADAQVRQLMAQGHKVEAIKRVRKLTGIGLKKAKEYVEALPDAPSLSTLSSNTLSLIHNRELEAEVRHLLATGKKIEAIRRVREVTGLGLLDAKNYLELLSESR